MQSTNNDYATLNEILSQPEAWHDALDEITRRYDELRAFFEQHQPDQLLFVGCGSPFFMSRSAASLARAITRLDSQAHPASDFWLYPEQTFSAQRNSMMVVISRSGETTETLKAIEGYQAHGRDAIVAITCYDESPLARTIQPVLLAKAAHEVGLAQTRSFTSMYLLAQGLLHAFANRALSTRFLELPSLCQALIDQYHDFAWSFGASMHERFQRVFFLGGGAFYGLACEAMLKMKEMSLSPSEAYHMMEFRHGPMSMVNGETLIVGLVAESTVPFEARVLSEMRQKGATVLAITSTALPDAAADHQIMLPQGLTDIERGALYLPILHLIIYYHTVAKGLNPDRPHNLTAVIKLDNDHTNKI